MVPKEDYERLEKELRESHARNGKILKEVEKKEK
jgi:hypothetical protein